MFATKGPSTTASRSPPAETYRFNTIAFPTKLAPSTARMIHQPTYQVRHIATPIGNINAPIIITDMLRSESKPKPTNIAASAEYACQSGTKIVTKLKQPTMIHTQPTKAARMDLLGKTRHYLTRASSLFFGNL